MNDKNCRAAKMFVFVKNTNSFSFRQFNFRFSTGTRIRTQIKGFGDPYATVAPCPCVKKAINCDGLTLRKDNLYRLTAAGQWLFYRNQYCY